MISLLKRTFWFLILTVAPSVGLAQSAFFEVASTPYDRQMQRIEPFLNAPAAYAVYAPSLDAVNGWMSSLRMLPYQYSRQWRTPYELEMDRVGDCKGKALALYGWMRSKGASNVRFVIGKRRVEDARTHAWLEWDTQVGTFLLDPTFNWTATPKTEDWQNYVAFYGYRGGHKYRAGKAMLVNRTLATRNPAAPAHGAVTRTVPFTYRTYSNSWPVYEQQPIQNNSQPRPAYTSALRSSQSQMHNFSRRIDAQRKPVPNTVRHNQLARPAFVQSGPITKQGCAESELFIQH